MPKHILLVDDSVTIAKMVEIAFAREDVVVTTARNGDEAGARARAQRPDFLLIDAVLPGRSGYDVCAELRVGALRDVPTIILFGSQPYDEARGKSVGADGGLAKPFETQALIDRVQQLLTRPAVDVASLSLGTAPTPLATAQVVAQIEAAAAAAPTIPQPSTVSKPAAAPAAKPPEPARASPPPSMAARPATGPRPIASQLPNVRPTLAGLPTASSTAPPAAQPRPQLAGPPPSPRATVQGMPTADTAPSGPLQSGESNPRSTQVGTPQAPAVPESHSAVAASMRTMVDAEAPVLPGAASPIAARPPQSVAARGADTTGQTGGSAMPPSRTAIPAPAVPLARPARPTPPATPRPHTPGAMAAASAPPARPAAAREGAEPLASISASAPRMPRPSLIPNAPTPSARAPESISAPATPQLAAAAAPGIAASVAREVAPRVAEAISSLAARGPEYEAIARLSREVIEQVVWEVVPDLAEVIIRSELDRLIKDRARA